jgi:hypothetical protein
MVYELAGHSIVFYIMCFRLCGAGFETEDVEPGGVPVAAS